jgi:hypothetical protein
MWKQAFSYPFQDADWFRKTLLAGCILIIPFFGPVIILGWGLEICRQALRKPAGAVPPPRPAAHFRGGLKVLGVILFCLLPLLIAVSLLELGIRLPPVLGLKEQPEQVIVTILGGLFGIVCVFLGLAMPMLACAEIGRLAETGRLRDALPLGAAIRTVVHAPRSFLLLLPGLFAQALSGWIGVLVCCVGLAVSLPYGVAVQAHWLGRVYAEESAARFPPPAADKVRKSIQKEG